MPTDSRSGKVEEPPSQIEEVGPEGLVVEFDDERVDGRAPDGCGDILALPPRRDPGDVCCRGRFSMRTEDDPEYVPVPLIDRRSAG